MGLHFHLGMQSKVMSPAHGHTVPGHCHLQNATYSWGALLTEGSWVWTIWHQLALNLSPVKILEVGTCGLNTPGGQPGESPQNLGHPGVCMY